MKYLLTIFLILLFSFVFEWFVAWVLHQHPYFNRQMFWFGIVTVGVCVYWVSNFLNNKCNNFYDDHNEDDEHM